MKIITFFIIMILSNTVYCQAVRNGSILIGEIKKIKLGVVTFDPDDANDVTVQLRKLKTIGAGKTIFRIETIDNQLYFGRLLASDAPNTAYIKKVPDSILLLNLQNISVLYPFHKSFVERFGGSVGLGYNYTRSSGFGRLNFDGNVSYSHKKDQLSFSSSLIYTVTDSVSTRDREDISLKNNYYYNKNWFFTVFLAYQRNLELGLLRRYQEGLGIGNKFLTSQYIYSWARTGFVLNQEKSAESVYSGTLAEIFGQLELNIFRFEKPEINVLFTESIYYSLSQSGRFRNDGSLNLTWEVINDFNLNIELYNNYDNQPPGSNHELDYGFVFGLKYKF